MATTGFFARLGNLWQGFWSIWISGREKANPEIAYENAINGMITRYNGLKRATAAIIGRREELEGRFTERSRELHQVQGDLDTAVATGQDDLALVLIQKKGQLEAEVAELKAELDAAMREADSAKASLIQVQGEIRKLRGEKDAMLARLRSAEAKVRIQEQLEGFSIEADVKALDNVREHIKTTVAQANLGRELQEASLDTRLAQLRQQTGDVQARAELDRLKAARAAQQAQAQGAGKKTL
ncbi:MAG TPA: PspA/IM30 family protein [Anaeromyxobacteraceae bacterium]|nr:PspA/IM30 family protein [Anaeromyxobacteraceae bacterium]